MPDYADRVTVVHDLPSTTWSWRKCILAGSSAPAGDSKREALSIQPLRRRDTYKPINIDVRYRGGPEGSFTVRARGRTWRFPGYVAMIDVIQFINGA